MESVLLKAALVGAALFNAFLMPGYALTRRFIRTKDPIELFAWSLGLGLVVVSVLSFSIGMFFHVWVKPPLVFAVANAISLTWLPGFLRDAASLAGRRRLSGEPLDARPKRQALKIAAFASAAFLCFLVQYDKQEFHMTCVNYPVGYITGIPMGDGTDSNPERNDYLTLKLTQREGSTAAIAATASLFQFFGFRLFYALSNLTAFLFAFLIGARRGNGARAGAALAVLLTFNPYLASVAELDENAIALMSLTMTAWALMRGGRHCFLAGALFGVAFGSRHVLLPGILGPLSAALLGRNRLKNAALTLAGFFLPSFVWAAHHRMAFGSLKYHESFHHTPIPFAHEFMGVPFSLTAVLEWPFVPELLRSPYNGFPQPILIPLALASALGMVLSACFVLGLVWLAMNRRREFAALFFFAFPVFFILIIQGNSSEVTKLRLSICLLGPLMYCVWLGLLKAWRAPKRLAWLAGIFAASVALGFGVRSLEKLRFPVDVREYALHPAMPRETEAEYALARREFARGNLAPSGMFNIVMRAVLPAQWAQAAYELAHSRYEDQTETIGQRVAVYFEPKIFNRSYKPGFQWAPDDMTGLAKKKTVRLKINLDEAPARAAPLIERLENPVRGELDAASMTEPLYLTNRKLPFYEGAMDILVRRERIAGFELILVALLTRKPGFYDAPPVPLEKNELVFEMNDTAHLSVLYAVHSMPLVAFGWDVEFDRHAGGEMRVTGKKF